MSLILSLGGVALEGFEIPSRVGFGGAQALAIHRLPGGVRIIDAMGRDDADLSWSGILSGAQATDRARLLDAMRVSGVAQTLSWDVFGYIVVISRLEMSYNNPWWIPYKISCAVIEDLAQGSTVSASDFASGILSDLTAAAGFVDVAGVITATGLAGALTMNSASHAAASIAFGEVTSTISTNITQAEVGLQTDDVSSLVSNSGSLAQLCAARGYVGRAFGNFNLVGM